MCVDISFLKNIGLGLLPFPFIKFIDSSVPINLMGVKSPIKNKVNEADISPVT